MQLPVYSLKSVNWYVYGKDKKLLLENYPISKKLDFRGLEYPFLPVSDIDGKDVLIEFFSGHLLPFHYLRFWGNDQRQYLIKKLEKALTTDIAHIEGYTLSNIVFAEGKLYVLPPKREGYTLDVVIEQLKTYLSAYSLDVYGKVPDVEYADVSLPIKSGVYQIEKPFSFAEIYGLMRNLVIWGYYPVLTVSPSDFESTEIFMRELAFYLPWAGKTGIYDMIPSMSLIMNYDVKINVGVSRIVEHILDSLGVPKVAFILLGVGVSVFDELLPLVDRRNVAIYTDLSVRDKVYVDGKWNDVQDEVSTLLSCHRTTAPNYTDVLFVWENVHPLTDISCREDTSVSIENCENLDAVILFDLWKYTGNMEFLIKAVWKDRHSYRLISHDLYDALVKSGLINKNGFFLYLVHGVIRNGMVDMYHKVRALGGIRRKKTGLIHIMDMIINMYLGDLPDEDEIMSILDISCNPAPGRLYWKLLLIAGYISRTSWNERYEKLHAPFMDIFYMEPYDGMDKWLFLTAGNALAVTYMLKGDNSSAYSIIKNILSFAHSFGYLDLLSKLYNNLSLLLSEVSPRLSSKYLLMSTIYALVSGGTSVGGVFASLLSEEIQRLPFDVLKRIYDVALSLPLDDMQEFALVSTWTLLLIQRGYIKEAERSLYLMEKKYDFPTGELIKDLEYYYLRLTLDMLKGNISAQDSASHVLFDLVKKLPPMYYRPDIHRQLAQYFYTVGDEDKLSTICQLVEDRYGSDSIAYIISKGFLLALKGNLHKAIDYMKDAYRRQLHVWKLLDTARTSFIIGDLYCQMGKPKLASVYYKKGEILLSRIDGVKLLKILMSQSNVCVKLDLLTDLESRISYFSGEARALMDDMYNIIVDLEGENFFLSRILDMFSIVTDISNIDVLLEYILIEILYIMPAEKGYIATVSDEGIWVSYSIDGRNPSKSEFRYSPEEVVRMGGVFLTSPSVISEVEFVDNVHLVVYLQNDSTRDAFSDVDEYLLAELTEVVRIAVFVSTLGSFSIKDRLTSLYVRWYGMKRGKEEFAKAKRGIYPISVLYMDLDGFKEVNDTYGHSVGDKVLERVGSIIQRSIRYMDVPFRYGGDEFVVILPATSLTNAKEVARRIVDGVRNFFKAYPYNISISIGVASYPDDKVNSFEELISLADRRLYKAKRMGKNRFFAEEDDGK